MNELRVRLAFCITLGFLATTLVLVATAHFRLESEMMDLTRQKYGFTPNFVSRAASENAEDWAWQSRFSPEEIGLITREVWYSSVLTALPLLIATLGLGWLMTKSSATPMRTLLSQVRGLGPHSLARRISLPPGDEQARDLAKQLNDLLTRLNQSFAEVNDYAAKVAHELRTPLAIVRLKVEQLEGKIPADVQEELDVELMRLNYMVEQSLTIARADRGQLPWDKKPVDLALMMKELVDDFELLAEDEGREVKINAKPGATISTDINYCRQICHALMTNAMMHGEGLIRVRVRERDGVVTLLVANRIRHGLKKARNSLGLGLRVIQALLTHQEDVSYRTHNGGVVHATRMTFPHIIALRASRQKTTVS